MNMKSYFAAFHPYKACLQKMYCPKEKKSKKFSQWGNKHLIIKHLLSILFLIFNEGERKVAIQDQLARQQAHENRNKYSPALSILDSLAEASASDLIQLREGAAVARAALREVESLHQTRLDMFKLLRGNYVSAPQIVDLGVFLADVMKSEFAIAKARVSDYNVDYRVEFENIDVSDHRGVHVSCDVYVLRHVIANLVGVRLVSLCSSELVSAQIARKFCYRGSVAVVFQGECRNSRTEATCLRFAVRDTGTGIPEALRNRLFDNAVVTADARGTGYVSS